MGSQQNDAQTDRNALFRLIVSGRISLTSLVEALAVAEHRNFRKSCETLRISQSSISNRITTLEAVIGFRLFERRNGVRVTFEGQQFLSVINEAVSLINQALRPTSLLPTSTESRLMVGVQSSSAGGFPPDKASWILIVRAGVAARSQTHEGGRHARSRLAEPGAV